MATDFMQKVNILNVNEAHESPEILINENSSLFTLELKEILLL